MTRDDFDVPADLDRENADEEELRGRYVWDEFDDYEPHESALEADWFTGGEK